MAAGSAAVLGAAVLTVASATPAQAAVALTCPATVPVYAIDGDGRLKWYGHRDAGGGSWSWASGSGAQIGHGWHGFKRVFSGGNGVIYAVDGSGYLKWYRHTGASTGANTWASGSGKVIGHGWGGFVDVVADGTGVIYALDADGNLRWYRHLSPTTGGTGWASGSGTVIRTGWKAITKLIPGRDGVIFGINTKGLVRWYKHLNPSGGGSTFGTGTGLVTGEEWDRYRTPSGAGAGVFYAVDSGGRLWWERHADPQAGAPVWYERRQIGSGWGSFTSVFADVASCAPASSTGYATGSGGRTLYYVNGRVAAVLTPGARTAVLYGTTVRKFSESTTTATVSTRAWVRLLPGPWSTSASWASSWLSANVGSTSEDILEIASQYITGAPDRYKNGLRYAGDAHYGPVGEEGRIEGSDFNDYLGIPWKYGDRVDEPEPDQKDSLDCSGFVRMVYGYRSGYPMEIGTPTGTALPRRAVQMHASAPGVMVVDGGTAKPTSYAALQPGDLLFWDASTDDGTAIDHVGIYLGVDSNGKHRFVSSRKTVDGPTLGDVGGHSLLDNGTLYDRSWRAAKRL
ncbi:tachylectin-related carbohydrate-binding protein [Thermobispora bispora]|uniref:tachylectin-related carbohydrate-binding protein n=1 Tax=Thermobispora bispora TaxID=2006 RepID=UPI00030E5777|nr:tachylectin-related carbohydrate-binding protein [Thermobispora bispora]